MSNGVSIAAIGDDLLVVNELGDGEREYFIDNGRLFLRVYDDENDPQRVTGVYRIGISIEHQEIDRAR